ncbi:hypothetical protein [Chryseobacterium limigenitum]|uniref:hypothetical protein n=1 Tax=Chryseobacterium limigenitum TaxID=1612149 RepID=UPI00092FE390|nr:hypothetical protein [Chryseobacterium limigenitum]
MLEKDFIKTSLDVSLLSKHDPVFQKQKLSSHDLEYLQEVVNRLKENNSLENFFKEINEIPQDKPELTALAGYLHFKIMFN